MPIPELRHAGGFVLRTPLLPWATLESLFADLEVGPVLAAGRDEDLDEAIARDGARFTERLRALVADPVVRESLFLASPTLSERLDRWLAGDDPEAAATERSVLRYVSRMAARATPFGLFAGCAYGEVREDGQTSLAVAGRTGLRRHTRLDYGFLAGITAGVETDPQHRPGLRFFPNSSLYRAGGRLRMTERKVDRGRVRYHRVTFEEDEALTATLDRAANGATADELAHALVDDDVTLDDAAEYVSELIASQVVVSDIGPAVTGGDPVAGIVERLSGHAASAMVAEELAAADEAVLALDAHGPGVEPAAYKAIAERLTKIEPDLDLSRLFQVDLAKPGARPSLGRDVLDEIARAVEVLRRITPTGEPEDLQRFRSAFATRYEQREVPLLEALDEEIGVGFDDPRNPASEGKPLLAGLAVRGPAGGDAGGMTFRSADLSRLQLLLAAAAAGSTEIVLDDDDIDSLALGTPAVLPDAFACAVSVVAASPDAFRAGDFRVHMQGLVGPSGARMLGRFAHVDDDIAALVRRHLADEEALRPDAVFAEVVHLPEGRLGNVIARPVLRAHEIPFLGQSGAPRDQHIDPHDLLVSVRGDRVVLRSARLGVEVVPRLTNAHNFRMNSTAPYRFLAAVQQDGVTGGMGWSWGVLGGATFLPRVVHRRLVLARAQWTLVGKDIGSIVEATSPAGRYRAVQALRETYRVPRWVAVAGGDNELPVDLDSAQGCEAFAHEVKRTPIVVFKELLNGPTGSCAEGPEGQYTHELLVPLTRPPSPGSPGSDDAPRARATPRVVEPLARVESAFPPGSAWLSVYLRTGKATADGVLAEVVQPFVAEVLGEGLAERWFFIRYGDPWHLRLRFAGDPATLNGDVLPRLRARAAVPLADGRIADMSVHTYDREVDRYGGPDAIELAESMFHADSHAALSIVSATRSDDGLDARWRIALVASDRVLADLGLDVRERQREVRLWRDSFADEQGPDGVGVKRFTGALLRRERAALEPLLAPGADGGDDPVLRHAFAALDRRSAVFAPAFARLRELDAGGRLTNRPEDVARSLVHMQDNRMLRGAARLQEFVLADLLDRLYSARIGREASAR